MKETYLHIVKRSFMPCVTLLGFKVTLDGYVPMWLNIDPFTNLDSYLNLNLLLLIEFEQLVVDDLPNPIFQFFFIFESHARCLHESVHLGAH